MPQLNTQRSHDSTTSSSSDKIKQAQPPNRAHNALLQQIGLGVRLKVTSGGHKLGQDSNATEREEHTNCSDVAPPAASSPTSSSSLPPLPPPPGAGGDTASGDNSSLHTPPNSDASPSRSPPETASKPSGKHGVKMPSYHQENGITSLDNIDGTKLHGYQPIPDAAPTWKKAMIDKKNQQLVEDARTEFMNRKAEEEKWRDVPAWKRELIMLKEKKMKETNAPLEQQRRRQEEEDRRLKNLPEWKRNLVVKKKD